MKYPKDMLIVRSVIALSFLSSIFLCFIMLLRESQFWAVVLFCFIFVLIIFWILIGRLSRTKQSISWFLSIAALNIFIIVPELVLRVADFHYESNIQFGYPRPTHFMRLIPDENLFWKLPSAHPKINSWGFPGREIVTPKPMNTYRILFLGDSCTQEGYPEIVEFFLNSEHHNPQSQFESVILAVSGYSSHQGLALAELYGLEVEPDLVVVYFGWNDHWLAYGSIDSEKTIQDSEKHWNKIIDSAYQNSRILQAIKKISNSLSGVNDTLPIDQVRVPIVDYKENLLNIKSVFSKRNIPVIYITAPTSHYRLGVPDKLVRLKFIPNKNFAVLKHKKYNQTVREVVAETEAFLLDLEKDFNSYDNVGKIFKEDGIHFSSLGMALVAKRISDFVSKSLITSNKIKELE